jgi:hypothetical protein
MILIGYGRPAGAAAGLRIETFTTSTDGSNDASSQLAIPPGIRAGSTLVVALRIGNSTASPTITGVPAGWSLVGSDNSDSGFYVYKKTAAGTEGGTTIAWTTSAAGAVAFAFAEIVGAAGDVQATFAGATLDPPPHSPSGGGADTIWIAVTSCRRNDNNITAPPAGYTAGTPLVTWSWAQGRTGANDVTLGAAFRRATAPSEDPGAFAWTGTRTAPQACTISVR